MIIVNADKVVLTGGKEMKKVAYRHSGYPGGITGTRYDALMAERPVFAVEKAIKGMLPKNRLGRSMVRKLHVVAGAEHPHAPQKPEPYTLGRPPKWEGLPLKTRHIVPRRSPPPRPKAPTAAGRGGLSARRPRRRSPTPPRRARRRRPPPPRRATAKQDHREEVHREEVHRQEATAKKPAAESAEKE